MRLRRNSKIFGILFLFSMVVILSTIFRVLPGITVQIKTYPVVSPGYLVSQRNNQLTLQSLIFTRTGPQDILSLPLSFNASTTLRSYEPRRETGFLTLFQPNNTSNVPSMLNLHIWDEICGNKLASLLHYPLFPLMPSRRRFLHSLLIPNFGIQYGARIFGYLKINSPGLYVFQMNKEEGEMQVWLASNHSPTTATLVCHNRKVLATKSLEAGLFYIEILLKQGYKPEQRTLKWKIPGSSTFQVIDDRHFLPYFDDRGFPGKDVILDYSVPHNMPMHKKDSILKEHDTVENQRRSTMYLLPYVPEEDTANLLPTCPYEPSYVVHGKLERYQGVWETHYSAIYPNDASNMTAILKDGQPQLIFGNDILEENIARDIAAKVMEAFERRHPGKYTLVDVLNVEENADPVKGSRYLVELKLMSTATKEQYRFSEYVYQPIDKQSLCYPDNFKWNKTATVNIILTVGNQGRWAKHFIDTISRIYEATKDNNINVIIVDFDSHDLDLKRALEMSQIPRYTLLRKFGKFYKSEAIQQGASTILDPNSIVLQVDLHLTMPLDFVDNVRKHCVQGKMGYSPCVTRLSCGSYMEKPIGFWEVVGYGIFGIYKQDWDTFGGMNVAEFRNRWGGEDWEMLDRVMMAGFEVERLKMLHFNHIFHTKKGMWEDMN